MQYADTSSDTSYFSFILVQLPYYLFILQTA
jgi:hypothetical protein